MLGFSLKLFKILNLSFNISFLRKQQVIRIQRLLYLGLAWVSNKLYVPEFKIRLFDNSFFYIYSEKSKIKCFQSRINLLKERTNILLQNYPTPLEMSHYDLLYMH